MPLNVTQRRQFDHGISSVASNNFGKASKAFNYLINTDPGTACDAYRGLTFLQVQNNGHSDLETFIDVVRTFDSFAEYSKMSDLVEQIAGKLQPGVKSPENLVPYGKFDDDGKFKFHGLTFLVSTKERWLAAGVAARLDRAKDLDTGEYTISPDELEENDDLLQVAYQIAGASRGHHQILDIVSAFNFAAARQWGEVVNILSAWTATSNLDWGLGDTPGSQNNIISSIASALSAEAFLHLDDISAADQLLNIPTEYVGPLSQMRFLSGVALRMIGREEEAMEKFGATYSINSKRFNEVSQYQNDTNKEFYRTNRDNIAKRTSYWNFATEPNLEAEKAEARDRDRENIIEDALAELDVFIGMEDVKTQVRDIKDKVEMQQILQERGLGGDEKGGVNMIFQGPPGTGKTTIARIMGDIFYGLGVLNKRNVSEVSRGDLVGRYQGETAKQTKEQFEKSRGGVFFLDEAYALVADSGHGGDTFGKEALDTVLPLMYNHRDDTCTIFAGYKKDMDRLLDVNQGLRSRINFYVDFSSYSPSELADIAEMYAKKLKKVLSPAAKQVIIDKLTSVERASHHDGTPLIDVMGNARCANNIVSACEKHILKRLKSTGKPMFDMTDEDLTTITAEDADKATDDVVMQFAK